MGKQHLKAHFNFYYCRYDVVSYQLLIWKHILISTIVDRFKVCQIKNIWKHILISTIVDIFMKFIVTQIWKHILISTIVDIVFNAMIRVFESTF